MKLFELWATIGLDTRDFLLGIKSARETAQSFGNTIQGTVKASTVAVGNLMSTAVEKVASGFVDMTKQAFEYVATLEQNIGGSEQVFGDYAAEIQNWGKEAFQYVGLSEGEYLEYANKMGAILQGLGFSQAESFDLVTDAIQRGADVASIMGLDVQEAMTALTALSKGQFNLMDNLGVAMTEDTLQAYALEAGIDKAVSKMSQPEKILLGFDMFLNKSTYAMGNYAKELDTLSGSFQTAKAAFDNLLAGSGTVDDFVRTVENAARVAFKNLKEIVPRLGQSIVAAGKLFAPKVESVLNNLWDNELPGFITRGVNGLINGVNDLLGTNIPTISEIKLPTWAEMETKATLWWSGIKPSFQNLFDWTLKMFNEPDEGVDEAAAAIQDWWDTKALPGILSVSSWSLKLFGYPVEDDDKIKSHFNGWWSVAKKLVEAEATWALQLFGVPDASLNDIKLLVGDWWAGVESTVVEACGWVLKNPQMPDSGIVVESIKSWWSTILKRIGVLDLSSLVSWGKWTKIASFWDENYSSTQGSFFSNVWDAIWSDPPEPKASGLSYVPYDNYAARLHAGEAVLTRQQAENWRAGGNGGASADEIAAAVASALSGMTVQMDKQTVGHLVSGTVSRDIAKKAKRTRRYATT